MKQNDRQKEILKYIDSLGDNKAGVSDIFDFLKKQKDYEKVSKITVNRDLVKLIQEDFLKKIGGGKATKYVLSKYYKIAKFIDVEKYFDLGPKDRDVKENFDFSVFNNLEKIFTDDELNKLEKLNKKYQENISKLSKTIIKKEFERLTIELSWKSSQIEGNTYTLLESEFLIKYGNLAEDKSKMDAQMILNHKNCIDYIIENKEIFDELSISKIQNIHSILTEKLEISGGIRERAVGITGTKYTPPDNQFQIREALEKFITLVNSQQNPFAKTFLTLILLPYIQVFEDGNKRTSRMNC